MQIKIITVPILGGEAINEDLNVFLRTKKVIQLEKQMVVSNGSAFWCFCVTWIDGTAPDKEKVDYKKVLDEVTFQRFSKLREIRKRLAQDEDVPAYAIFTDEELSAIARIEDLSLVKMKAIKGIGEKRLEKYGKFFIETDNNATGK